MTDTLMTTDPIPKRERDGPYWAEFGAVHRQGYGPGFLFTVSPPAFADDVARALNAEIALLQQGQEP